MECLAHWPGYVSSLPELLVSLIPRNLSPPTPRLIPYTILANPRNIGITIQLRSISLNLDSPLTLVEQGPGLSVWSLAEPIGQQLTNIAAAAATMHGR